MPRLLLLLVLAFVSAGGAHAQSILLDETYGPADVVGFNIRVPDLQADAAGRVLVVRGTGFPPVSELVVYRADAQGRPDPSFGVGGRATLPLPRDTSRSSLIAFGQVLPEPDGSARLVVSAGGTLMTGRLLSDGTLDPTFLPDGLRRVSQPLSLDLVDARADGSRTLALSRFSYGPWKCALTALAADGQPDLSFGDGGTVMAPTDRECLPVGVVTTPEGPLVLARVWESTSVTAERAAVFAFTTAGGVRTSFGDGGVAVLPFPNDTFRAGDAIAWSGRLIVGGTSGSDLVLAAYTPAGLLDTSFSGTGVFRIAPLAGPPSRGTVGLAEGGDGLLVFTTATVQGDVEGLAAGALAQPGVLVRQPTADGLFWKRFSYSDIRTYHYRGSSVVGVPDGNVVVAGTMTLSGSSLEEARLSRLLVRSSTAGEVIGALSATVLSVEPNPLTVAARVTLALSAPASARVTVLDALGRTIAVLHDGPLASGPHTLTLDAARLPAGVYAIVAAVGAERSVARVTVVR